MTPEQLRNEARRFFAQCQSRIEGTGTEQYYDPETQTQAFETMTIPQLFEEARQEAYDLANYALMISLRIDMLQSRFEHDYRQQEAAADDKPNLIPVKPYRDSHGY